MKVAILAGGLGSRLAELAGSRAKALVRIGEHPILWHLIRYYCHFGYHEFVVALGHQGDSVRAYFGEGAYRLEHTGKPSLQRWRNEASIVDLVETGQGTENGGRIKRLAPFLDGKTFMLTWCDGLADIDLHALLAFHRQHGRLATLTAVHPPGRFGRLDLAGDLVRSFEEKTTSEHEWINGAFFVLEPGVLERIDGDRARFEHDVLSQLARDGELMAYRHGSFWRCVDTPKEAEELNVLWRNGAPWKIWEASDAGAGDRQ
ncbi:MAG: NTP transferase domain-containing protein [Rhodospirillales bacterium]|nr:NTP transferase domain-containing protein [Rhodospirillales bacterium]